MDAAVDKKDVPVENKGLDNTTDNNNDGIHDTTERTSEADGKLEKADSSNSEEEDLSLTQLEEKKLLRRIDLALVPYLSLLYLLSFLDRVNIGQANVAGLKQDLRLVGNEYQIALSVFFISYIVFETPALLLLRKMKPHRLIPLIMVLWGLNMTFMGFVQSAGGLQASRFTLGLSESALFPGLNFLLSTWYKRSELNLRVAFFFSGATLAGAFGGILAYGLKYIPFPAHEHFHSNYVPPTGGTPGGWRWIFIIEGVITVLCAIPAPWLIVDFPADKNRILTATEAKKWNHRLDISQGVSNADVPYSNKYIIQAFTDYRTYLYAILYMSIAMPLYSLALFTPTVIAELDFTGTSANLLSVPPYVLGFITTIGTGIVSDRYLVRGPFIIFWGIITLVGYIIQISDVSAGVKYFAIFLCVAGVSPNIATAISYVGVQFGPVWKRATVMGFFFTMGNGSGLISSNIYPTTEAPRFIKGHSINLAFAALTIFITLAIMGVNYKENKRRDAISYAHLDGRDVDPLKLDSEEEKARWGYQGYTRQQLLELGDKHLGFRYVY